MQERSTYFQTDLEIEIIEMLKLSLVKRLEQYYRDRNYDDFIYTLKEIQHCDELLNTLKTEKQTAINIALGEGLEKL
jgi:hypothetical protein